MSTENKTTPITDEELENVTGGIQITPLPAKPIPAPTTTPAQPLPSPTPLPAKPSTGKGKPTAKPIQYI